MALSYGMLQAQVHQLMGALGGRRMDVRGLVASGGTLTAGTGFTVSKTATGTYAITYSSTFAADPFLQVTPVTVAIAHPSTHSASGCTVVTFNTAGTATDGDFFFSADG